MVFGTPADSEKELPEIEKMTVSAQHGQMRGSLKLKRSQGCKSDSSMPSQAAWKGETHNTTRQLAR